MLIAVQELFEVVQSELLAAAASMEGGKWSGLDPDARGRIGRKTREEVNRLRAVFDGIHATIDTLPGAHLTPRELECAIEDTGARLARLRATQAQLDDLLREADAAAADSDAAMVEG